MGALSPGRRWFFFVWDGLAPGLCWQLGPTVSQSFRVQGQLEGGEPCIGLFW